jgi:hypothetical protein
MRSILVSLALAVAALSLAPDSAYAQLIHGRLLEEGTNRPIDGATVQLLDAGGRELDRIAQSNASGIFMIRVEPGRYTLRIRRIGYQALTTPIITIEDRQNHEATYRVSPVAIRLATQRITERRNLEWGRDGWQRRRELGAGVFLTRMDLEGREGLPLVEALDGIAGLRLVPSGMLESLQGWRCIYFMVNRIPTRHVPQYRVTGEETFLTLNEVVPNTDDVMGIEVYREFKEVPPDFRLDAWPMSRSQMGMQTRRPDEYPNRRLPAGEPPPCGIVNIWTRAAW